MLKYIVKRIINLIPVAIIISILVFVLSKSMPGDPVLAMMPKDGRMTKAQQEQMYKNLEKRYGYDKSLPEQYFMWMGRSLKMCIRDSFYTHHKIML